MADDPGEREAVEREVERALDRQRWTVDTSRVAVVLCTGIAASVCASAWQTLGANPYTVSAAAILATSVLLMLSSFMSDERQIPMVKELIDDAAEGGHSVRDAIASYNRAAADFNESVVSRVVYWSISQSLTALLAGILAATSMLLEIRR